MYRVDNHDEERKWGMIAHLSALIMYIGIPFGNIIGPLIVYMVKKDELPFAGEQAKEALNFHITLTIGYIVLIPFVFIIIGIPLMILLGLVQLIFTIVAGIKANEGVYYRYPFSFRFL
ncbi:DUF4870 domain-containing protein [Prolixibacteraceae bacterium JC049]|jgi:uncharacterized Tic20 family protein|nr:DUF4870 domain-containing protein [Prolixibacteraceae bacterium JC049]